MDQRSSGFTLIEMAIVLVIVGLLVGGVLSGQQLIQNARVRNLISQQDGVKAAFFGFQDRYRALPGDYASADSNINCVTFTCLNGNGNGRIEAGVAGAIHEEILAWNHLSAAGFINGSYSMATSGVSTPAPGNTPTNPFGTYVQLAYDGQWGVSSNLLGPNQVSRHTLKTGNQVPVAPPATTRLLYGT
jgi:prepilin-type N-terminal cleavage/methylation domain-containing protein